MSRRKFRPAAEPPKPKPPEQEGCTAADVTLDPGERVTSFGVVRVGLQFMAVKGDTHKGVTTWKPISGTGDIHAAHAIAEDALHLHGLTRAQHRYEEVS